MLKTTRINTQWRFFPGDAADADFMGYDDSAWRTVTLPHDWSVEHPFDRSNASGTGYLPGGIGWYRKHFTISEPLSGKRVRIIFGGVYKHAKVWINSYYLGYRAYGYSTFSFDVTDFIRPGENVLAVRAEHTDVADSRWFTGSGIYRDVTLEISGGNGFREYGVFVTTARADTQSAELSIRYETDGADRVLMELLDQKRDKVWEGASEGERGTVGFSVDAPRLWSPDTPYLYTLRAYAWKDGSVRDIYEVPVGIREIRFTPDKGFFLNGENMKIRGVCVHHDAGALGAAVPKKVWERRLRKLKECGCNALRTAHNPPDPNLLDACDELGFLVMDEAFDEWEGCKNKWWQGHNVYPPKHFGYSEDFPVWHRQDLEGMVLRDRNHPSIIIWSIGNEVDYPNDPYVTPLFHEVLGNNDANKPLAERIYDERKPDAQRLAKVAKELVEIVHALDTTRPVTSAMSFPELSTRTGFSDALDIFGYNYRENLYSRDRERFPEKVILGSENSHDPGAWRAVDESEDISGQFLWTGVDFLGECRGWPVRISQAGALDLAGFEKPVFAQRKAMWTGKPYARLAAGPKDSMWEQRFVWSEAGGAEQVVTCYTNQEEASLILNGRTIGRGKAGRENGWHISWKVPYEPGTLEVYAGKAWDRLSTPGKAESIEAAADTKCLKADGQDIAQIEILLLDKDGNPAAEDDRVLYLQVLGDAEIIGIENGKPDDLTPYSEPFRSTWQGRLLVYVRAGMMPGKVLVHAFDRQNLTCDIELTQS